MMRRTVFLLVLGLMATAVVDVAKAQRPTVAEQYFLSALNQERTSRGIAPVRLDARLNQAAATHAEQMAEHGSISHQFSGEPELSTRGSIAGARFDRITENVAEGPSATTLHDAWMHSPGHRANILDRGVDAVGIAVVERHGQLYAVEDFQRTVQTLSLEQQEAAVAMLLDKAGLELVPDKAARQTCAQSSGYAGEEQPSFVVRFTAGDLAMLPSQLRQRLALGQDHRAAVGACRSGSGGVFSSYSIAVLLYP